MRSLQTCAILFVLSGLSLWSCKNTSADNDLLREIRQNFADPPQSSGVNCWWWWLNGNVNRAAITKDLEAMKARNFQGAMIFDAGGHNQRGNLDIPAGPLYGSKEWIDLFVFALDEARRLGLEMGFNIQSGWNLGGPRVTAEYAAKQICHSQHAIQGGRRILMALDQPFSRYGFYQDIAVLAFPDVPGNRQEGISDLNLKLGFRELGGSAPDCRFLLENDPGKAGTGLRVRKEEVRNISERMDASGNLDWQAPAGDWVILRIGYTCTDAHVSTSSGDWQGLVLDYMSREAFEFYWQDVVEPILEAAGDHVGSTLKYMETDSWECGGMNWTGDFAEEFRQYTGYDLTAFLPVVAGYVVEDAASSNAFLADFRKTLAHLVATEHYAVFQEYAHRLDMGIQPESAGPHAGPLDGIKNYGYSDIVMSEFWSPSPHRPRPENRFYLKQASSAAHIYGKKIVGAESFTTIGPHWNDELWHDQKSAFDHEICAGLNRLYFHTFTCSPPEMGLPGQEYFAGTHVNPQVTWWDQSGPFIDYMHRIQSVVREGSFVADVLYYYGDHVPNVFPFKHADPAGVLPGFDYDVCDETVFLQLEIKDGEIVVPGGVRYRLLALPDHRVLSLPVLEKLGEIVQEGATVLGHKPEKTTSLAGGPGAQEAFGKLVREIWGGSMVRQGEHDYGKGKVAWGCSAREYLLEQKIPADFQVLGNNSKTDFDYIHYTLGESDIFFVSNQTAQRQKINARFRVSGKQPELWDPLSGDIRAAGAFTQDKGRTTLPLTLEPYASVLLVFDEAIPENRQGSAPGNYPDFAGCMDIDGAWTVSFDPRWGGPGSVVFPELTDWTRHPDEGIRHYSGAAIYTKDFLWEAEPGEDQKYFLRLGSVKDVGIAEVKINGRDKGILWTAPFRVEITDELQEGINFLEIKVVNSWYNRVAGDQLFPDKKQYTSTNIRLDHDFRGRPREAIPLEASGLMGPVSIQTIRKQAPAPRKPNVLFIAIDDLRPELGCFGAEHIHSPNIDGLAGEGVLFTRAYCQAPHCGPSRSSLLTGMRARKPALHMSVSELAPGTLTLPAAFRQAGYYTLCNGKIAHQLEDMAEESWSEAPFSLVNGPKDNNHLTWHDPGSGRYILEKNGRGPFYEAPDVSDDTYIDGQTCSKTIGELKRLAGRDQPFFMACGFVRPHLPFYAPKKYWDLYDREEIEIAGNRYRPENSPEALKGSGEFSSYHDHDIEYNSGEFHRIARHGYFACVSYADAQVGRLLGTLDELGIRENTIVVLWGDHGWNLGEHGFWSKHNLLHTSKNAPLIISAPGYSRGARNHGIVELTDLYPTLCELAGIDLPDHLEGTSLLPILIDPDHEGKEAAYTCWRDGSSVTTRDFSYTEYDNGERMLFDLEQDPDENHNVAEDPEYGRVVKTLANLLIIKQAS